MPRFAANLSMMYQEHAFLDRFAAAAADGFKGVEFLFPYDFSPEDVAAARTSAGVEIALFNAPPGDWATGERGVASLPGREDEFKRGIETALRYTDALGNKRLHVMAGLLANEADRAAHHAVYVKNLAYAAQQAQAHDVTIVIEPINTRDIPGFFLNRQSDAHAVRDEVGASNLKVQFDLYHCQIVEGDLAMKMKQYIGNGDGVGHIQIAGVPLRHEPDAGEVNFAYLMEQLDVLGYEGWVGAEYRPAGKTSDGLAWLRAWGG
jgi:hydroxypyruvate isomerase